MVLSLEAAFREASGDETGVTDFYQFLSLSYNMSQGGSRDSVAFASEFKRFSQRMSVTEDAAFIQREFELRQLLISFGIYRDEIIEFEKKRTRGGDATLEADEDEQGETSAAKKLLRCITKVTASNKSMMVQKKLQAFVMDNTGFKKVSGPGGLEKPGTDASQRFKWLASYHDWCNKKGREGRRDTGHSTLHGRLRRDESPEVPACTISTAVSRDGGLQSAAIRRESAVKQGALPFNKAGRRAAMDRNKDTCVSPHVFFTIQRLEGSKGKGTVRCHSTSTLPQLSNGMSRRETWERLTEADRIKASWKAAEN